MRSDILTVPVQLPDFFDMTLASPYGRLCNLAFFQRPEVRADLLPVLQALAAQGEQHPALHEEEVRFKVGDRIVPVRQSMVANNQLLGASRAVPEFAEGYEPEIHCAIDVLTGPDAVLVDIGSNWGPITLQAALRPGFSGQVHCFEPQRAAVEMLRTFTESLGLQDRVFPNWMALSDHDGQARFSQEVWSGNTHVLEADAPEADTGFECRVARLDDVLKVKPNLLKLDVEGHEARVLAGAASILQQHRPIVIFEDFQNSCHDHYAQLAGLGYQFYSLGWYNPYEDSINEKPMPDLPVQLLSLQSFTLQDRAALPDRINALASPEPIVA